MKISSLETVLLKLPLPRAVTLPGGQHAASIKTIDIVLVHLKTDSPVTGLGFTYSFTAGKLLKSVLDDHIAPLITGDDPLRVEWLLAKARSELAHLGFTGTVAQAYAAVDFALWDLKGQLAKMPVHQMLGGYRTKLKAIVSDTATPALGVQQAVKETRKLLDRGAAGVQIELGTDDPDVDADRLRQIVEGLPSGPWLEVNAAGRYDAASALYMSRVFEEYGIDSFLDPLPADDLRGLERLAGKLEINLGVGGDSVEESLRLMTVNGVNTLRLDPVRLGGLTAARKLAHAAELQKIAIEPVRLPEVGSHLAASVVYGRVCEYVDWFQDLFEGGPVFQNGQLIVSDTPGWGLKLNEAFAAKHQFD